VFFAYMFASVFANVLRVCLRVCIHDTSHRWWYNIKPENHTCLTFYKGNWAILIVFLCHFIHFLWRTHRKHIFKSGYFFC